MPAYNFKDQFVPAIESGRKTTTIRQLRKKRPTRIGDRLFLFNRMRQAKCRLIKDTECVSLRPIAIMTSCCAGVVKLEGTELSEVEVGKLARRDGFKTASEFLAFFNDNYGPNFEGELIEWRALT